MGGFRALLADPLLLELEERVKAHRAVIVAHGETHVSDEKALLADLARLQPEAGEALSLLDLVVISKKRRRITALLQELVAAIRQARRRAGASFHAALTAGTFFNRPAGVPKSWEEHRGNGPFPGGLGALRLHPELVERHSSNYPLVFVCPPEERDVRITVSQVHTHKIRGADILIVAEKNAELTLSAEGRSTGDDRYWSTVVEHGVHPDAPRNVSKSITVD